MEFSSVCSVLIISLLLVIQVYGTIVPSTEDIVEGVVPKCEGGVFRKQVAWTAFPTPVVPGVKLPVECITKVRRVTTGEATADMAVPGHVVYRSVAHLLPGPVTLEATV